MPSAGEPGPHTRRRFLGGAVAAATTPAFAGPLLAARAAETETPRPPDSPGVRTHAIAVTPDRRTIWSADTGATTITAHRGRDLTRGRSVDVGGPPVSIAISPDGQVALVVTAFGDSAGLAIVHLPTREVDRVDAGPDPYAVAFAPDGRSAYVVGGGADGALTRFDTRSWSTREPVALGRHPRGLALLPDGDRALVALNGDAAVAVVALPRNSVARRVPTPPYPYLLAVSPDGTRALLSHNGFGSAAVSPIDLSRGRVRPPVAVGADPAGVAFSESGAVALVAATAAGAVTVLDGRSWRPRRVVRRTGAPRSVAVAGRRAIVADGATGRLSAIRLGAGR